MELDNGPSFTGNMMIPLAVVAQGLLNATYQRAQVPTSLVAATLLDGRYVILPVETPLCEGSSLAILDCLRCEASEPLLLVGAQIWQNASAILQLPPLRVGMCYSLVTMNVDNHTPALNSVVSPVLFSPSLNSRLLVVDLHVRPTLNRSLVVPTTVLLSIARSDNQNSNIGHGSANAHSSSRSCTVLPWEKWGHNTSYFGNANIVDGCDSRLVVVESVAGQGSKVAVIYDFDTAPALLEDVRDLAEGSAAPSFSVPAPSETPTSWPAWDTLSTSRVVPAAPYRRIVSDIELREHEVVGIYGDGLFIYNNRFNVP
jgi:hypothetical protein